MIASKIKLSEEEANSMPGRQEIENTLGGPIPGIRAVDLDSDYWQNDEATLVIAIEANDALAAARIGRMATEWGVDEFDYKKMTGELGQGVIVFRIWWD